MKKKDEILKCAPKIYKKFNDNQKAMWNNFYGAFIEELKLLSTMKKSPSLEVVAHNLACEAIWELEYQNILKVKKVK